MENVPPYAINVRQSMVNAHLCTHKTFDNEKKEIQFVIPSGKEKIFREEFKASPYVMIEMRSTVFRFFADFDIHSAHDEYNPNKILSVFQDVFKTLFGKEQIVYFVAQRLTDKVVDIPEYTGKGIIIHEEKQFRKGLHFYFPELCVDSQVGKMIRHLFCQRCGLPDPWKTFDKAPYTIESGLYHHYSPREPPYKIIQSQGENHYDFFIRTDFKSMTPPLLDTSEVKCMYNNL